MTVVAPELLPKAGARSSKAVFTVEDDAGTVHHTQECRYRVMAVKPKGFAIKLVLDDPKVFVKPDLPEGEQRKVRWALFSTEGEALYYSEWLANMMRGDALTLTFEAVV